jgi:hypothetical protein
MSELIEKPKKTYRSIIDVPIKVEMQPIEHASSKVLSPDELAEQIEEARKGKAKVDSKYVGFELDERGHLFDYKFNYVRFLENMSHIIKTAKENRRKNPNNVYIENMKITDSPTTEKKKYV